MKLKIKNDKTNSTYKLRVFDIMNILILAIIPMTVPIKRKSKTMQAIQDDSHDSDVEQFDNESNSFITFTGSIFSIDYSCENVF